MGNGEKISKIGGRRTEEGIGAAIIGGGYWKSVEEKEIFFARGGNCLFPPTKKVKCMKRYQHTRLIIETLPRVENPSIFVFTAFISTCFLTLLFGRTI